jgi:hypothetical protein
MARFQPLAEQVAVDLGRREVILDGEIRDLRERALTIGRNDLSG